VAGTTADRGEDEAFREELEMLVDDGAQDADTNLNVTDKQYLYEVQLALAQHFERRGASDAVALIHRGVRVGVVTRRSLEWSRNTAGSASSRTGAGEQITLPGESNRYRLLEFSCPRRGCGCRAHLIFYDAAARPMCPNDKVPLELRR
jgi:hypothetical protein